MSQKFTKNLKNCNWLNESDEIETQSFEKFSKKDKNSSNVDVKREKNKTFTRFKTSKSSNFDDYYNED